MSFVLNKYNEVADFCYPVDQFSAKTSQYACGPYGTGYIKYMGYPGKGPTGTPADIDRWAFKMYTRYIGPDIPSDTNGTSVGQLYQMLGDAQQEAFPLVPFAFVQAPATVAAIKQSLSIGRPCIVAAAETGMHDIDNAEKVDYAWTPSGNHIIVISGIRPSDGAFAVRDPANIGATGQRGSGPANVHDGPVFYDPAKFGPIASVTSIIPAWLMSQTVQWDASQVRVHLQAALAGLPA